VIRSVDGGNFDKRACGRIGRGTKAPPQFGQASWNRCLAQSAQNVHSNEQIRASAEAGGKSLSQHSQLGLSVSIVLSCASFG
jgi:hypothetical protein